MRKVLVGSLERALASAFPTEWAEEWDRVGLLAGDPDRALTGVVLALDPTREAIARCVELGANALVTHHPAYLSAPNRLAPGRGAAGVLFAALDAGVALLNAHTNLDRAPAAGTLMPDLLGVAPIKPVERSTMPMALVTVFVPPSHAESVSEAMLAAGAGRIGEYERCSFTSAEGTGKFTPRQAAAPALGVTGEDDTAVEVRIEMIAPRTCAGGVAGAARAAHPYEEPLVVIANVDIARASARMGMLCAVAEGTDLANLAGRAADAFGVSPRVWGDSALLIDRVATATGSAGSLIGDAIVSGAQALVAGEVRYHDALDAVENGLAIIEVGHDASEWPLVGLLETVVLAVEGIDPAAVTRFPATPGWWTAQRSVE